MTRNRTCVIFGGSGFVGRAIIGQLREMGFRIVVPTRNRELVRGLTVVPEVRVVTADIYDPATLRKLLDDADVAINLVGILNEKGHHRGRGFYTAHRDLTGAIVEACTDAGVPRFLQMSALKASAKKFRNYMLVTECQLLSSRVFGFVAIYATTNRIKIFLLL